MRKRDRGVEARVFLDGRDKSTETPLRLAP